MKIPITPAGFNPSARALDFSNVARFNPARLLAVINSTARALIYDPVTVGLGITSSAGPVITLQTDTTSHHAGDLIVAFYDDAEAKQAVYDVHSAPFSGAVAMTPGATYPAQRSVEVDCTAAGDVTFTMADGSTRTKTCAVGSCSFPYAVTQWAGDESFAGAAFNMI